MAEGRFITIEGVEGVGKSTSIAFIEQSLRERGIQVITTREPGGTGISEEIRAILLNRTHTSMDALTELMLMFAARRQHVEELIKPALAAGTWVVSDRFTDSSYAYQGGGRGLDVAQIEALEEFSMGEFSPDLTLILDLPPREGLKRAANVGEADRFESEQLEFFEKVRTAFLRRAEDNDRYRIIDASQSIAGVSAQIGDALNELLERCL